MWFTYGFLLANGSRIAPLLLNLLADRRFLGDVEAVQELTDILVLDGGRLLDQSRRAGHGLDVDALQDQLVLLLGRVDDGHARSHVHLADVLLAQEVTDLDHAVVLGGHAVDGEMGVHGTHLVQETVSHTWKGIIGNKNKLAI